MRLSLIRRLPQRLHSLRNFSSSTNFEEDYAVWPREREGNNYDVNWSLVEDGVTPTGDAFRNARNSLLTSRIGKGEILIPQLMGDYKLLESGDDIAHDDFSSLLLTQQNVLTHSSELFVEDAFIGSSSETRLGVRVVSSNPAVALIARSLMIPNPSNEVNHKAKFNGWNLDERWQEPELTWNGKSYDIVMKQTVPKKGERPIIALVGGERSGSSVAVQFVETSGRIVGSNITVGEEAPVRAIIAAVGHAATVMINADSPTSLAVPSAILAGEKASAIVIEADDDLIAAAQKKKVLYGAYHNVISKADDASAAPLLSALWAGAIGLGASGSLSVDSLAAAVGAVGRSGMPSLPASSLRLLFYHKGKAGAMTEEEAVQRLVDLTDDSKKDLATAIIRSAKVAYVGSPEEALKGL